MLETRAIETRAVTACGAWPAHGVWRNARGRGERPVPRRHGALSLQRGPAEAEQPQRAHLSQRKVLTKSISYRMVIQP